jgi:HlyD family secretion protein
MRVKVRLTALLGGGLIVAVLAGGSLIPVSGAVVASGQVDAASRVKRVAHPRGGIVASIFVKDGQHVEAGQVLARLDDTVASTQTQLTGMTINQLLAQRARLEAEATGKSAITWPAELVGRRDSDAVNAITTEQNLFLTRRAEASNLRAQLSARIAQSQAELVSYQAQVSSARQQAALIQPERTGIDSLYDKGLIPISRRNQIERTAMELEGSIGSLQGSAAEARGKIAEIRAQLAQQEQTRRAEAGTQLAALNAQINQQRMAAADSSEQRDKSSLRAPCSGTISHLLIAAAGEVVQPNEVFAEIVPDRDQLVVEAMINPTDIERVAVNKTARIRFTSFDRTSTPEIPGKVIFVGPNRTTSPDGKTSFYVARIAIDRATLAAAPWLRLKPGMPSEVYIATGSRSLISYILKPLGDQFARTMKDR